MIIVWLYLALCAVCFVLMVWGWVRRIKELDGGDVVLMAFGSLIPLMNVIVALYYFGSSIKIMRSK